MEKKVSLRRSKRLKDNRDWLEIPYDLWLRILSMVSLIDRLTNVAAVCQTWRAAIADSFQSANTLDLSECSASLNHLSIARKAAILRLAFARGINLSLGNLRTLVLDSSFPVMDSHLLYAASRCPNVRELVFPGIYRITTMEVLEMVFKNWRRLESLALGWKFIPHNLIAIIGRNCPDLKELIICCPASDKDLVANIFSRMPRLRALKMHFSYPFSPPAYADQLPKWNLPELQEFSIVNGNFVAKFTRTPNEGWGFHISSTEDSEEIPMHPLVCNHRRLSFPGTD